MIDLHTHTTASDGTDTPAEILIRAQSAGLQALAITDHDTFAGADEAVRLHDGPLQVVRGVELSTRLSAETDPGSRSVHVLGYFFREPSADFRAWLDTLRRARRERNCGIARKLTELGMPVTIEEAEALGRNITGRPHFARLLRDKGYVRCLADAFQLYLGERCPAYVEREDPEPEEGIGRIVDAGGIASLAHARRLNKGGSPAEETLIARLAAAGLGAIEVWHTDHDEACRSRYLNLARKYGLAVTGGSDYHGDNKPDVLLGRGRNGSPKVSLDVLDELRRRAAH